MERRRTRVDGVAHGTHDDGGGASIQPRGRFVPVPPPSSHVGKRIPRAFLTARLPPSTAYENTWFTQGIEGRARGQDSHNVWHQ